LPRRRRGRAGGSGRLLLPWRRRGRVLRYTDAIRAVPVVEGGRRRIRRRRIVLV